ncbi:hypothetical protein FRB98_001288 [Tulasnella sp. 332]|nr:hypothetical protein FRB98_001288 [Tulasnella sp. 332]
MAPLQQQIPMAKASSSRASTGSVLYALPTKEWIIAPKSKPGRKPKKVIMSDEDEDEAKKCQIRLAIARANQRAFHERKRDQLATFQARIQQLEQGETERYVELQAIDKRLREENDLLKKENAVLRGELALLKGNLLVNDQLSSWGTSCNKRTALEVAEDVTRMLKRKKSKPQPQPGGTPATGVMDDSQNTPSLTTTDSSTPSSASASTPTILTDLPIDSAMGCNTTPSHSFHPTSPLEPTFKSCGFCTENTSCVCRELFMQDAMRGKDLAAEVGMNHQIISPIVRPATILDQLPPYQPPVPLRLKRTASGSKVPVFVINNLQGAVTTLPPISSFAAGPTCSGDPSNCDACSGDSFGQAFCAALSSACAEGRCTNCSSRRLGQVKTKTAKGPLLTRPLSTMQPVWGSAPSGPPTTMPTSHAWATLKAHPAIQKGTFNDLHLLADVVARSTPFATPRMGVEQLPVAGDGSRKIQVAVGPPQKSLGKDQEPEGLALAMEVEVDTARCCRGEKMVEVQMEGVQQALALLDQHMQNTE